MEALYDKYTKLKNKKFSEFDEGYKEQGEKFLNFVSASEELMQHLRSENENLQERVEDLRIEITSIRSTEDMESLECQKLLVEEERKRNYRFLNRNAAKQLTMEQVVLHSASCTFQALGEYLLE